MGNLNITPIEDVTPDYDAYSYINVRSTPVKSRDTLSRSSSATIIDIDGNIRVVNVGAVRYDEMHDGFLIEQARTNYFNQAYEIDGAYIIPGACTSQTITLPTAGYYTLWVHGDIVADIVPGTADGVIAGEATNGGEALEPFRADEGRADVTPVGGYGYFIITATTPGTVIINISGYVADSGDYCQLEYGLYPTSYIPNATTSTTRQGDSIVVPLREFADLFLP